MPIEIRELVVRARVDNGHSANAPGERGGRFSSISKAELQVMIQGCVAKMLKAHKLQNER